MSIPIWAYICENWSALFSSAGVSASGSGVSCAAASLFDLLALLVLERFSEPEGLASGFSIGGGSGVMPMFGGAVSVVGMFGGAVSVMPMFGELPFKTGDALFVGVDDGSDFGWR